MWNEGACNSSVFVANAAGAVAVIIVYNNETPITPFDDGGPRKVSLVFGRGSTDPLSCFQQLVKAKTTDQPPAGWSSRAATSAATYSPARTPR